jgi:hypothetical protein
MTDPADTDFSLSFPPGYGKQLNEHWDTFDAVEADLAKLGIFPLEKPRSVIPDVTAELLTSHNNVQYAEAFARMRAWYDYILNVRARQKALEIQLENQMDILATDTKQAFLRHAEDHGMKKPSEEMIKHYVKAQPRYQELIREIQPIKQTLVILDGRLDGLDKGLKILSRNLELIRQQIESEGWGHAKKVGYGT